MYGTYPYSDVPYTNTPGLPPAVSLNTPADAATIADTTPTLAFTGTDTNADDIEYNIQIATAGTNTGTMVSQPTVTFADAIKGGTGAGGSQARGQSFIANGNYISRISIYTWKAGVPTGNWDITIRDGLNGNVLTSVTTALSSIVNGGWTNFDLTIPFPTTNGTKYYIHILKSPDINDVTNYGSVGITAGNVYTSGGYLSRDSNIWSEDTVTYDMSFAIYSPTTLSKVSTTDAGFVDITNGADTHPFASGDQISYTVQAGDALTAGTYYWRASGIDPSGSNSCGAWSTTWSFTITAGGIKVWNGSAWVIKPIKVWNGSAWVIKPIKVWNGSAWVIKG